MAITNGYASLEEAKSWLNLEGDTRDDALIERAVEAASRAIDRYTHRRFYLDANATARTYVVTDPLTLFVDDIGSTTGLVIATDDDADGTFETTWASTDYQTEPTNALAIGRAITQVQALDGCWPRNRYRRALVSVTAKWGWPAVPIEIEQAALILAARYFKRRKTPEGVLTFGGNDSVGAIRVSHTDRDVLTLIGPYKRAVFA